MSRKREAPTSWYLPGYGLDTYHLEDEIEAYATDDQSNDSSAEAKFQRGASPDAFIHLPIVFMAGGSVNSQVSSAQDPSVTTHPAGTLDKICRETGAFIKPKPGNSQMFQIWGNEDQVSQAQDMLRDLVPKWTKVHPSSMAKQAETQSKNVKNSVLEKLRKGPSWSELTTELRFLWPPEGPSPQQVFGPQLEGLDHLRLELDIHIFLRDDLKNYICVATSGEADMEKVSCELRKSWVQYVRQTNFRVKAYIDEPPPPIIKRRGA